MNEFVYIIQAEGCNRIKIGRAQNVEARLQALHTASPFPLRVLRVVETADAIALERHLAVEQLDWCLALLRRKDVLQTLTATVDTKEPMV